METESEDKKHRFLLRQLEFSAVSWVTSLILHILLVGGLMYVTFTHIQTAEQGEEESFTVELGTTQGADTVEPGLIAADSQVSSTSVIETPTVSAEIMLTPVETSVVAIPTASDELAETVTGSASFNESLAGGDTGGTAGFFGLTAGGSSFVYIIDSSGSMSGDKLVAATHELRRSVSALSSEMSFYLIFYNDSYNPMPSAKLVAATNSNKSKYLNWSRSISATGGTNPLEAIIYAISLKPDAIWLLTDGIFDGQMVGRITQANKSRIPIHTLAFGAGADVQQLRDIAESNKGKFKMVSFTR